MAITIHCDVKDPITAEEYIEHILQNVDITDAESLIEAAPHLRALAANKNIVLDVFNKNLESYVNHRRTSQYNPQSFIIASHMSKEKSFFLRGNIWSAISKNNTVQALEERVFTYNIAHDHNFYFMTVGYHGPGYTTRIYEYDHALTAGYIGERVDLKFLEETTLPVGKVMLYRPGKDVHLQLPPEEMSISLNLMIADSADQSREQYFFDVDSKKIVGYPFSAAVFRRSSLIQLAGHFADDRTIELLMDIALNQPGARNRVTAIDSLLRLNADELPLILESTVNDKDEIVQAYSKVVMEAGDDCTQLRMWRKQYGLDCRDEISTLSRKSLGETIR